MEVPGEAELSLVDFRLLASRTLRMNFCCFKPPSLWEFEWQPQETDTRPHLYREGLGRAGRSPQLADDHSWLGEVRRGRLPAPLPRLLVQSSDLCP